MPIYEYTCTDCGHRFEIIRAMKEADEPITCHDCHSNHTHRVVSVFNAQSGSRIITGGNSGGCSGCAGGTCSSCNSN